jgi:predicted DNA-binding transcriptional regulator AlpA
MESSSNRPRYSTVRRVRERYDNKSHMWLWRQLRRDPDFPKPFKINGRRHWDDAELDAYDRAKMAGREDSL